MEKLEFNHEPELLTNMAPNHTVHPALCLDLDGTVRRSKSDWIFIKNAADIELMPGIEKAIWSYRNKGWLVFGISNQGGVAHAYKFPFEIRDEVDATLQLFSTNPFHAIKVCMNDVTGRIAPYNIRSLCRKPDIGMLALLEAESFEMGKIVDWDKSLFVGDRPEDFQCAERAGINFMWIDNFLSMHESTPVTEIPPDDMIKFIYKNGKCCITEQQLSTSKQLYVIPLNYFAEWKHPHIAFFPKAAVLQQTCACAFVHEICIFEGKLQESSTIKYALEVIEHENKRREIIYHDIRKLKKINPDGTDTQLY